jgi:hypothetical protein
MRKSVCVLAILAASISTAAVAKDLKQDKKTTAPTVSATQMNDAEMDKVTAGAWEGNSVSVGAAGLIQEVGGPYTANRFGYNGFTNSDGRGAQFLLQP